MYEMRSAMMRVLHEVLKANAGYAATFGEKATLTLPPARHFTILTCMDARLDPAKYAGLSEGDAHVIRNAGGRASDDALRWDSRQAVAGDGRHFGENVIRKPGRRKHYACQ
jgi:carbonic anhydrase